MNTCTSCGLPIPDNQGRSCSVCYGTSGDPYYGRDGYMLRIMEEPHLEEEQERRRLEDEYNRYIIEMMDGEDQLENNP